MDEIYHLWGLQQTEWHLIINYAKAEYFIALVLLAYSTLKL